MRGLSLSKVLAVVLLLVGSLAGAQVPYPQPSKSDQELFCDPSSKMYDSKYCDKLKDATIREKVNKANDKCTKANSEYRSAKGKLSTACADAGGVLNAVGKGVDKAGVVTDNSCERNILRCKYCATGKENIIENLGCSEMGEEVDDVDAVRLNGDIMNALKGQSTFSTADIERDVTSCVPKSAEDLDSLRKRVAESRKDIRSSQEDISKAQAELVELENEGKAKENEYRDREEELGTKVKDRIQAIKRRFENTQAEIGKQVTELQGKWDQAEAAVRNIQEQRLQAELAYSDAVRTLEAQCHASALKQVADLRKVEYEAWQNKTLTRGGFDQTMRQVGAPAKKKYNDKALEFYNDCTSDRSYKSASASANDRKAAAFRTADNALISLRQSQQRISDDAKSLQTTQLQQTQQRATEDMNQESDSLYKALTRIDREKATSQAQAQAKWLQKKQAMDRLTINATEDRKDYDEAVAEERVIRQAARSTRGGKEGTTAKAISAQEDAMDRAREVVSSCTCSVDGGKSSEGGEAACRTACTFLASQMDEGSEETCKGLIQSKRPDETKGEALHERTPPRKR